MSASWNANTDAYTAGYRLYYGTASGTYQWSVDVGSQTSAPLNLSPGSYFFAVRAYNAGYEYGPQSSEATVTVGDTGGSGGGGGGGGSTSAPTAVINATLESPTWAIVTWSTTNATSITINGNAVGPTGSAGLSVSGSATFTILARSAAGQTATANVTVGGSGSGGGTGGGGGGSAPAPTAAINGSVDSPGVAFVTWTTANATSATLNGTAIPVIGSVKLPMNGPTTYTIVARNNTGQTATANVTVGGTGGGDTGGGGGGGGSTTVPTAVINATLETPTWAIVTWSTTNATSATINGNAVGASGTAGMSVSGATTFTILVRNNTGQTATANVTVGGSGGGTGGGGGGSGPAPTAAINGSVDSPGVAFVTWTTANATSATLNGSAIPVIGSVKLPMTGPTTYTIVARNDAGQTATANVTVGGTGGGTGGGTTPAPTAWIGASLDSWNTAFVAWSSSNASYVTINGGPVAPSGSVKTPIYVTTTYTIVVRDATGRTATSTATVIVP